MMRWLPAALLASGLTLLFLSDSQTAPAGDARVVYRYLPRSYDIMFKESELASAHVDTLFTDDPLWLTARDGRDPD